MSGGQVLEETTSTRTEEQLVVFRLESENYGIDIFRVHEIIRLREITPIPQTEPHIRGLVNLRGKTIPVVDLRTRFMMSPGEDGDATRIIVVESEGGNVGMVVDEVCEVLTLNGDDVEQTPSLVNNVATEFVRGVAKRDDRLITLLDLDLALAA
jgi:purine-binding chemotaxis protein CheW